MTNEEKAIELFTSEVGDLNVPDFDREFAKQKQVLIDKACDAYCKCADTFHIQSQNISVEWIANIIVVLEN